MLVSLSMTISFMKEIQYPPTHPPTPKKTAFVIGGGWIKEYQTVCKQTAEALHSFRCTVALIFI